MDLNVANAETVFEEATRQSHDRAIVALGWRPPSPTGGSQAKLSNFEWKELLTPGARLYEQWRAQVDAAAATLLRLQSAGVPVLWRPYPQANANKFWWAGRKKESAQLYRQLFDRLVNHHGLHNLVWVWTAAEPGFGPDAPGQFADYFPGLQFADALAIGPGNSAASWRRDRELARFAVGKTIGLEMYGWLPNSAMLAAPAAWSWFIASGTAEPDAVRALYSNPRVISIPPDQRSSAPLGLFTDHGDVGLVVHPGSTVYDPARRTYTISGSGDNMWFSTDAFQFAWKRVSGDVDLAADIDFEGAGGEGHRKAVLTVTQPISILDSSPIVK